MAKRRRKGKRKLTKAERRAIAIRNLNKGRRPKRRRARAAAAEAPRRRKRRHVRAAAGAAAPRRRRARAAAAEAPRRRKSARKSGRRFTSKQRAAALRNLGKARSARRRVKRAHRKHAVRAYSYHRKPKRIRVRAHRSYEAPKRRRRSSRRQSQAAASRRTHRRGHRRERYVMENPLSGGELFVSIITGAIGYGTMDMVDRYLATHALTASTATNQGTAANSTGYVDTPATTGGAQGYQGLYNGTAILAPMNWQRWTAGLLGPAVPLIAAQMIKAPVGRSALQMFGFGALMNTVGRGLTQLVSSLTATTAFAQRIYDPELRAQMKQISNSGGTYSGPSLPYSGLDVATGGNGLGRAQLGMGSVADTVANMLKCSGGSRCRCSSCACNQQPNPVTSQPPGTYQPPISPPQSGGNPITWGGNPPTGGSFTPQPPPPPPPPPPQSTPTGGSGGPPVVVSTGNLPRNPIGYTPPQQGIRGVPEKRKNTRDWGYKESDADVG